MVLVVSESAELLVVFKPEGIATIAERDPATPNLRTLLETERSERLFVVHRLDKDVSGLLLLARTAAAHRELSLTFEHRLAEKTYLALVHGSVVRDEGSIDAPLREFGSGRMGVAARGKASLTHYRVLQRGPRQTLVAARPVTGRRHQIRVHLYSLGHPIAGDPRYGERELSKQVGRLMLHAWQLALPALSFAPAQRFQAAPPPSFVRELERAGLNWAPA